MREMNLDAQEAQGKVKMKRHTKTGCNLNGQKSMAKRILKAVREKQVFTHKGASIRITVDFSPETMEAKG